MNSRAVRSEVHALAWPMVGTNLLTRGINIVDMMLVGHLGKNALAGVGIGQMILFAGMIATFSISVGTTVMVAFYTGSGNHARRNSIMKTTLITAAICGVGLCALGRTYSEHIGRFLGASPEVLAVAMNYVRIIWFFYTFRMLQMVLSSAFQGMGDSRTPLYVVGTSNVVHALAAYCLIYGKLGLPALGVQGAALATGLSETGAVIALFILLNKKSGVTLSVPFSSRSDIVKTARLCLPVVGERMMTSSMQWTYNAIVLNVTVAAYAAHQAGMNIEAFSFLPGIAFMQAATALVGRNLGAKNVAAARESGYQSNLVAMIIMSVFSVTFLFIPEYWMRLFTSDPEVIEYGITFCRIGAFLQIPLAASLVFGGALRGAGETKWVMGTTFVGAWVVRIPIALAAYFLNWGMFWVWMAMLFDWYVRGSLMFWRFRRGGWKLDGDRRIE
jgi:putative MATE family efflux protein